ncbi:Tm-1-like ATP-binding domain-containing protein [Cellulomonas endometrii]|uniref:Tm-1-like ATP-binding domain-containing protein n=1 Tax=Cellulomonas endometrii TaxID=3036301 RepID=UPI0024AE578E|nr:Tm-1-like ATP-binding domain-containing protein [Cellulomonas endometrii]
MTTVVLVGALDTKRDDYLWLRDQLHGLGLRTVLVDVGTFSEGDDADVTPADVARAAGSDLARLRADQDRGAAMTVLGAGAAVVARRLYDEGRLDAVLAAAGSGGSSVAAQAMQALPVGVPKLLVSTMTSGDVSPYVGATDVTMMYSVADVAGINSVSRVVLGNAVAAAAAMAQAHRDRVEHPAPAEDKPLVGATMFGLTTPAVEEAKARLEELGYEVVVFHATGSGGRAMEALVDGGFLAGVLDLTTTELADELCGGVLTAGPDRLEAAGRHGVPQLVSLGALDMVNFGGRATVPERYEGRTFLVHNPTVTLMRTTAAELAELGSLIATKLRAATGPTLVLVPRRGLSGIDVEGGPFFDPAADRAAVTALEDGLAGSGVEVQELDLAINDPGFGRSAADALHRLIRTTPAGTAGHDEGKR